MLEFALWPLWRLLKGPLKALLKDKFSLVGGQLKALLSSTIDDLVTALQEVFFDTDTWRHLAKGTLQKKGSDRYSDRVLSVEVFPLDAIVGSSKLRGALARRLLENVRLDALRNDAGIADQDWGAIVDQYAGDVIRHALPFALNRMITYGLPLYSSHHVIGVAQLEPIRICGKAGHHTLVVLYDKSAFPNDGVAKAPKLWKGRAKASYDYTLADYDGFSAS